MGISIIDLHSTAYCDGHIETILKNTDDFSPENVGENDTLTKTATYIRTNKFVVCAIAGPIGNAGTFREEMPSDIYCLCAYFHPAKAAFFELKGNTAVIIHTCI